MYRNYYNEYTKRAEEITSAVRTPPKEQTDGADAQIGSKAKSGQAKCPGRTGSLADAGHNKKPSNTLFGLRGDDIILGALILFLIKEEKADMTVILALAFIFLSDLG